MPENKPFKPDFSKKKYSITIEVFENCNKILITPYGDYKPTYHEMVGVLEVNKINMIMDQTSHNRKISKKKK